MTYFWTPSTLAAYAAAHGRSITPQYVRRLCVKGRIQAWRAGRRDWIIENTEARRFLAEWLGAAGEGQAE